MDMLDAAGTVAAKYLKVRRRRPAAREFTPHPQVEGTQRIGQLDLRFDRAGILAVTRDGRDVFGTPDHPRHNNRRRLHRIAELVLEPDYGDAWGTRIPPTIGDDPRADFCLAFLGDFHTAVETAPDAVRWRGRYTGGDWKVRRLEWTVTAAASADGRRIDFTTDVNWDTGSRRLRVLVPVRSQAASAVYEVPFGFIERAYDPARLDYSLWNSNTLEYPTLHWVWRPCDERQGVALLNRGLPCNRWTPGRLDLSLVRSPEYPFCVVEPGSYEFWDTDGQRDAGRHRFEYSLFPYYDGMTAGELTRVGYAYNLPAPVEPPFRILGDVVVTAWKLAEDGDGWILRLQEGSGRGTRLLLDFGEETASRTVVRTNLLEQPAGEPVRGRFYDTVLHRHGILTLRIR